MSQNYQCSRHEKLKYVAPTCSNALQRKQVEACVGKDFQLGVYNTNNTNTKCQAECGISSQLHRSRRHFTPRGAHTRESGVVCQTARRRFHDIKRTTANDDDPQSSAFRSTQCSLPRDTNRVSVTKFSTVCGNRRFIYVLRGNRHWLQS